MKKIEKLLGEMFVERGVVTAEQVRVMIQEQLQAQDKKFIGAMLNEGGFITEDDLFITLAEQFGIEFTELGKKEINWNVPTGFSPSFIKTHKCFPMRVDEETVVLVITNPLDAWMMDTAENAVAPNKLEVVLAKESDMDALIKEYQKHLLRKMMDGFKQD